MNIRIAPDLFEEFKEWCWSQKVNLTDGVVLAMRGAMEQKPSKTPADKRRGEVIDKVCTLLQDLK